MKTLLLIALALFLGCSPIYTKDRWVKMYLVPDAIETFEMQKICNEHIVFGFTSTGNDTVYWK